MMGLNVKILINLLARKQPRLIAGLAITPVPQLAIVLQVILVVTHATFRLVMMMAHGVNGWIVLIISQCHVNHRDLLANKNHSEEWLYFQ